MRKVDESILLFLLLLLRWMGLRRLSMTIFLVLSMRGMVLVVAAAVIASFSFSCYV